MRPYTTFSIALLATAAVAASAYAAEQTGRPAPPSQAQQAADTDFGKLSVEGAKAFRDIQLTRLAIYDAKPGDAKKYVLDAQTAIGQSKKDDTIFTKAESELRAPTKMAAPQHADTTPVAWLPVDGQLILDENYVASPQKASAMADANKSLKQGDRKGAMEKLKLAGINVDFTMAVVPLAATTSDIDKASSLIGEGKYYEANIALLHAENSVRFDVADARVPMTTAGKTAKK